MGLIKVTMSLKQEKEYSSCDCFIHSEPTVVLFSQFTLNLKSDARSEFVIDTLYRKQG